METPTADRRLVRLACGLSIAAAALFVYGMVWPYYRLGLAGLSDRHIVTQPRAEATALFQLVPLAFLLTPVAELFALLAAAVAFRKDGAVRATWRETPLRLLSVLCAGGLALSVL